MAVLTPYWVNKVKFYPDGEITCEVCVPARPGITAHNITPCEHVWELLQRGHDRQQLKIMADNESLSDVGIPILKNKSSLFVVWLFRIPSSTMFEVHVFYGDGRSGRATLGVFVPGVDARWALRDMVTSWLAQKLVPHCASLQCRSCKRKFKPDILTAATMWLLWCLAVYGRCTSCQSMSDMSEDIPDVSARPTGPATCPSISRLPKTRRYVKFSTEGR